MAVPFVENYEGDGSNRIFTVISPILSESHVRVDFYYEDVIGEGFTDHHITSGNWDIINNSVVFRVPPEDGYIVKISVSSDGEGLDIAPSDVTNVAASLNKIVDVSNNMEYIQTVSSIQEAITSIYSDKATLDSIYDDKSTLDRVYASIDNIDSAEENANEAQLKAWEAEAERLTSDSYATKNANTFVNIVTSNGDGTFTYTPTTEYSSKHWAEVGASGYINDGSTSLVSAYSSSKTQEMHDAQAMSIANLATAQGQISNAVSPVYASIPKSPAIGILDFQVLTASSNDTIFELDATNNILKLYQNGGYTFLSTIEIKSNVSASRDLTFRLVNDDTDVVLQTVTTTLTIASGNSEILPMSTLLVVEDAPVNVRVEVTCSDTGFEFRSFNSLVTSGVGTGSENIDAIDDSLGSLITEVLI